MLIAQSVAHGMIDLLEVAQGLFFCYLIIPRTLAMEDRTALPAATWYACMELGLFGELVVGEGVLQARGRAVERDRTETKLRALEQPHTAQTKREHMELPAAAQ